MKKKIFSLIMFAFLVAGLLTACNSPSNISGQFSQESYVVSINDAIDFFEELTVKGLEKTDIVLSSSNIDVLTEEEDGVYKAKSSGDAYVFAKFGNKVVAKTKVSVRYKFSSPKNIQIDETGLVSWDKSFISIEKQTIFAEQYFVKFAQYNPDGTLGTVYEEFKDTNQLQLLDTGAYKLTIKALGNAEQNIDASEIIEKNINNGVVGLAQNPYLQVSDQIGNQTAVFHWNMEEVSYQIKYDVYIEGFKIFENLVQPKFEFDYSRFAGGQDIEILIEAKDAIGNHLASTTEFIIHKLSAPTVEYKFESKDGFVCWNGDENASSYRLKVTQLDELAEGETLADKEQVFVVENADTIQKFLTEYQGGAYDIEVMAVGKNEGLYLNSDTTSKLTVAKIEEPEIQIDFNGKSAEVAFPTSHYSTKYRVSCGGIKVLYDTNNGYSTSLNLAFMPAGAYTVSVIALPDEDASSENGVKALSYDEVITSNVINSNPFTFDFFVLGPISEISHSLSENTSTISFAEVENANVYNLYINDNLIEDVDFKIEDGKVYMAVDNLNQISPVDNKYTFKVEAQRIVDEKALSTMVTRSKTISILDVTTANASQTNGFFSWTEVAGNCEYYYEVYLADSNFNPTSDTPVLTGTTTETTSSEILELGNYYFIKIYTISTDINNYLDANFVDENCYFSQGFIATLQIESPRVTFSDENDLYTLTISGVEYGGRYQIYVDGSLDGEIVVSETKDSYQYTIANDFQNAKDYLVTVVASSGLIFDSNLYIPSDESEIIVSRLEKTTFSINYGQDAFERRVDETINFENVENSVYVEVSLDGTIIMDDGYIIDIMDYSKFADQFTLVTRYIADEPEGNVYYLDSLFTENKFVRTIAPNNLTFDTGYIKWTGPTAGTFDLYEMVITVVDSVNSDFYYTLEIGNEFSEYDLNSLIETLLLNNANFASAYRRAEKLQIELWAFDDGVDGDAYRLPSVNGVTVKGETKLDILTLEKPVVNYDYETGIISWQEEVEGSTYNIYVDGSLALEDYTTNSIALSALGSYDYLTAKRIKVQSFNSAYIDSPMSDEITIEEISINDSIAITKTDTSYIATFSILADQTRIAEVWVNGSKANVNYTQGASSANFDLVNFDTDTFTICLKALNETPGQYYLDSKEVSFTIENLADKTFSFEHFEQPLSSSNITIDYLSWTDFRGGLTGNSLQPIVYKVYVVNGANTYFFQSEVCQICLEEIESLIKVDLTGEVKIYVKAIVEKDYVLQGENAKGFYGIAQSTEFVSNKLEQPGTVQVKVFENASAESLLEKKMYAGVEIVVEDKWNDVNNIGFTLSWQYDDHASADGKASHTSYFTKDSIDAGIMTNASGYYHLFIKGEVDEELAKMKFANASQNVILKVYRANSIDANPTEFEVQRYDAVTNSEISDEGIITFNDSQNASYLLELKIADKVIYKSILASELNAEKTADLMGADFFGGIDDCGEYQITIIPFDENESILSSRTAEVLTGYKLAGLGAINITDEGNVTFTLLENNLTDLIFTAKMMIEGEEVEHDFTAKKVDESSTEFYISMLEILELFKDDTTITTGAYEFGFTVRKAGSINANWLEFGFNYDDSDSPKLVRGRDLEKDYILFDLTDGAVQTTSFSIKLTGLFRYETVVEVPDEDEVIDDGIIEDGTGEETGTEEVVPASETTTVVELKHETKEFYFYPSDVLGYWVTDLSGNDGYYADAKGNEANLIYTQCYIIDLRTLFEDIAYGTITLKISRVGKDTTTYYQFNPTSFGLFKLNAVDDSTTVQTRGLAIKDNVLSWKWVAQDTENEDIIPTAYYLIMEDILWGSVTKQLVTTSSVDLREVGMKTNTAYYISIIALNYNNKTIASNISKTIPSMKYLTPISLEVVDGKLSFDVSDFRNSKFMKDIVEFFAEDSPAQMYHNKIGLENYTSPFLFAPQTLERATMQIKFKSVAGGGSTNVEYIAKVPATILFPDIVIPFASSAYATPGMASYNDSYVNLLSRYSNIWLGNSATIEEANTKSMIDSIVGSNLGIGDGSLLIDDFARALPEGEYQVSVSQIGESYFVESNFSSSITVYIAASPELSLQTEEIDGKTYYTATVAPTMNMIDNGSGYVKQLSSRYKMQLRYQHATGLHYANQAVDFIIGYDGSEWHISYNGINLDNVISNVAWEGQALPKFKLNMTNLRGAMEEIGFGEELEPNQLLSVDIFTYSQDDGYVINGKSAKFNVRYLDLLAENIMFTNGEFVITGIDNYDILVTYKITSQSVSSFTQSFVGGKVVLNFEASGVYEYIALALNGSISPAMINVASDSYVIKNVYKLNAPTITTRNNNLNISYNSSDIRYMNTLKFNLANDISLKEVYKGADKGYYYQSDITATTGVIPYVVGSRDNQGDTVYPSELMAEKFFAYLSGNNGQFVETDEEVSEGDVLLVFSEGNAVMSSTQSSIDAIMLPYLGDFMLSEGNLALDCRMVGIDAVSNEAFEHMSGNIVYQIVVKYYGFDNTAGYTLMKLHEETFYSERHQAHDLMSVAQIVDSSFVNANYEYFTFSVTTLGALHSSASNPNAIKTLEGTYILLNSPVYYGPNPEYDTLPYGQHVLRSQDITTPILTRTPAPRLAQDNHGVLNGNLYFVIDKSLYYTESGAQTEAEYTANRIKIKAEYNTLSGKVSKHIGGSVAFATKTETGEENNIYVSVTPEEGLFIDAVGPIKFFVTIHGRDWNNGGNPAITSVPLVIENVYKLPNMDSLYYDVELVGEKTYINFTKYFQRVSIANDYSCYQVVVKYILNGDLETVYEESITQTSAIKRFEVRPDAYIIQIQVQDGQDATTTNPKKLLYSDCTYFEPQQTEVDGLGVTWNAQSLCFEWSWADGRTDEYEYYVTVNFKEGVSESDVVSTNSYMLQNSGTIENGGFVLRARKKSVGGLNDIYIFSEPVAYNGDIIEVSLFSGGNGSRLNPYLIANESDFVAIAKRNTINKQFYFKLSRDITVDTAVMFTMENEVLTPVIPEFYGILDGNGHRISVKSSTVCALAESYDSALIGQNSLIFTEYSSLFHTISTSAVVRNLYIDYTIEYRNLSGSSVMFAPIAAYNYGNIDNIHVTGLTIVSLSGTSQNNAFVGGLVGVNYGTISNCVNSTTFEYAMVQNLALNFGYGGIALFNGNKNNVLGKISKCFNQGEKQVTVKVNNNIVYMAGITLTNLGQISTSGNDGRFKLNASGAGITTFTGYMAGITITSSGILEYLYNNGVIENVSNYGTLLSGGIAYAVNGGTINYLVETVTGQPLVKSCTTQPTILGVIYAGQGSDTHVLISTRELASTEINCADGSILAITETADGFKASIV